MLRTKFRVNANGYFLLLEIHGQQVQSEVHYMRVVQKMLSEIVRSHVT